MHHPEGGEFVGVKLVNYLCASVYAEQGAQVSYRLTYLPKNNGIY